MGIRVGCINIDTNDLAGASTFWQQVTGYQVASTGDDHVYLHRPGVAIPIAGPGPG